MGQSGEGQKNAEAINNALVGQLSVSCLLLKKLRNTRIHQPGKGVRIGTFDRGKGMEFRAVFLPRLGASLFPESLGQQNSPSVSDDSDNSLTAEQQEHRQLQLDRLYVGMTLAVHFLYLLADEEPCAEIQNAEHYFD